MNEAAKTVSRGEIPWSRLIIQPCMANETEDIDRNLESTLSRSYTPFDTLVNTKSGAVSVVGSGPSLKENWKKLKRFKGDIIACNAALEFLLDRGITPQYAICFDADKLADEFAVPHKEVTYLIASRCTPNYFSRLNGCKVIVWHAAGDLNISTLLDKYNRMEAMVAGGSAAVTRGMVVAYAMGYRTLHLWGADSSFSNGDTHIRQSTTKEKTIDIKCGWSGREFITAPWMCQQAEDFKVLAPQLRSIGAKFVVHGDGLIPHIAEAMGIDVDGQSKTSQVWREAKQKAGILWSNL